MKKTLLAGMVCLVLLCTFLLPVGALTPTYTVTGAYSSSTYHQNIKTITKTGDQALDTVAAALSQLDYHEGNSTADFGGKNTKGSKNYTEFNRALGKIDSSYSYAWCAAFVSWCLDVAGAKESAGGSFASCTLWVERLQALGLYSTRASGYVPKQGDLIFFRSAGVGRASNHVGIVRYVKGNKVYTVEGNASNKVSIREYLLTDTYIVGYGKPKYTSASLGIDHTAHEDKSAGLYTVTNSFLNVREKPTAESKKLGTLDCGALLTVSDIQNGWGRITYGGKNAYISLDYADFTTPVFYSVSYDASGGQGSPNTHFYLSTQKANTSASIPEKEGFSFLYWESKTGERYLPTQELPQEDLLLTAVWEVVSSETIPPLDAAPPAPDAPSEDLPLPTPPITKSTAPAREAGVIFATLLAAGVLWWYSKRHLHA